MKKIIDIKYDCNGVYAKSEDGFVVRYPWVEEDESKDYVPVKDRDGVIGFTGIGKGNTLDWSERWGRANAWTTEDKEEVMRSLNKRLA